MLECSIIHDLQISTLTKLTSLEGRQLRTSNIIVEEPQLQPPLLGSPVGLHNTGILPAGDFTKKNSEDINLSMSYSSAAGWF